MATQVVSRIRRLCQTDLSLRRLFEAPTIAALAADLEDTRQTAVIPPIPATTRPSTLPLAFAQERLWFLTGLAPEASTYHIPEAMRLHGQVDVTALTASLNDIADGWSMGVLVQELTAHYTAYVDGDEPMLPGLPIQFGDYALWQRQWLATDKLAAQLAYWQEQLKEPRPVLELPTDHIRPSVQTYHGARHRFTLSPELTQALRSLSQANGVTLFMTLLAAFKTPYPAKTLSH